MTSDDKLGDKGRPSPHSATEAEPLRAAGTLSVRQMLEQFERKEIEPEQVVRRLLASYQLELGSAILALRELNSAVAQEVGEKLRQRIESFLAEFERPVAVRRAEPRTSFGQRLLDKDTKVLQRECIVFRLLLNPNQEVEFSVIYAAVKAFEPGVATGAMTMTLNRLIKEGLVVKRRRGRYQGTAVSRDQLMQIEHEIEARGAAMPPASVA